MNNMWILDYKIKQMEKDLKKMKSLMEEIKKEKGKERFSFLSGILKGKTDLSLKEIQSFKYKAKSLNEISS